MLFRLFSRLNPAIQKDGLTPDCTGIFYNLVLMIDVDKAWMNDRNNVPDNALVGFGFAVFRNILAPEEEAKFRRKSRSLETGYHYNDNSTRTYYSYESIYYTRI